MNTVPYKPSDAPRIVQVQDLAGLQARLAETAQKKATFEEELALVNADLDFAVASLRACRAAWQTVFGNGSAVPSPCPTTTADPGPHPEALALKAAKGGRVSERIEGANRRPGTAGAQEWDREALRALTDEILSAAGRPMVISQIVTELRRRKYELALRESSVAFRLRLVRHAGGFRSAGRRAGFERE